MTQPSQPSSDWVDRWEPEEVVRRLRDVIDFAPHVSEEVAHRLGVGRRDVEAVAHLLGDHGPMGPAELAKRLGISGPAATQLVDRMAEKGHLRRAPHAEDRRKTVIEVTPEGREDVLQHLIPMFVGFQRAAHDLEPSERASVVKFLDACLSSMRTIAPGLDTQ
ncbi:MAG TPA: MarR family transcriptional regulator [Microbacteriaceae bacterium]|nr:MarR family transcriptional regulator [Microbacteriaceae bacterium]